MTGPVQAGAAWIFAQLSPGAADVRMVGDHDEDF
jgi:hypothetical protein